MSRISHFILLLILSFHVSAQGETEELSDSTSTLRDSSFKKNTVQIEIFGKATIIGIAYDRILYRGSYDYHINFGTIPDLPSRNQQYTFNASLYYSTYNNTFDVLKGIGFNYILSYTDNPDRLFYRRTSIGPLIGVQWNFSQRWNMQVMYTPHVYFLKTIPKYTYPDGSSIILTEREFNMAFLWGGINIGYKF